MGLLDALSSDDAKLGIALLSASGYSPTPMSFGQRLGGALSMYNADRQASADRALRTKLLQSQIDENASQAELRKAQVAKQAQIQSLTSGLLGDFGGGSPAPSSPSADPLAQVPGGAAGLRGIPIERVAALKAAGGPDLIDAWKAVNIPTSISAGSYAFTPGQAPQYLADPTKGVGFKGGQISLLPGSENLVDLAGRTAAATAGAQANYKPIKVFNPATQREEFTSEGAVVGGRPLTPMAGPAGNVQSPGYSGGDRNAANAESIRIMQAELSDPTLSDADRAGITREIQRMQMQSGAAPVQSGSFAAGPSAEEAARAKANEAKLVDTSKADVVRDSAKLNDVKTANKFLGIVNQVEDVFKQGPTQTGIGAAVDSAAAIVGKSTKGAEAAQRLKALGGWLVANVPRMEGPQSNFDVANYQVMAADVANDKLPLERRKAALDSIKTMMQGVAGQQPQQVQSAPQTVSKSFKEFGYATQADAIKDAQNAMMRNPGARVEILRRLEAMGVKMPDARTGSF